MKTIDEQIDDFPQKATMSISLLFLSNLHMVAFPLFLLNFYDSLVSDQKFLDYALCFHIGSTTVFLVSFVCQLQLFMKNRKIN